MKPYVINLLAAALIVPTAIHAAEDDFATIEVKTHNLAGREITYNHSYNGVTLTAYTSAALDADSTFTITIPTAGIEFINLRAKDQSGELTDLFKMFYVLPGTTEVTVDPLADEPITVDAPTHNPLDGEAAETVNHLLYNIWLATATSGRHGNDMLGLLNDTVPSVVINKLNTFTDSIKGVYTDVSPAIRRTLENDARLNTLMIFNQCVYSHLGNENADDWKQELKRLRNECDLTDPVNALNPYFGSQIAPYLYFIDIYPDYVFPNNLTPDSVLRAETEYYLNTMGGKTAECAIGCMLYEDGAKNMFSPSAPVITESFKTLFPESGLIPLLDGMATANELFNNPETTDEIVFIDNSDIKSIADMLAPYKGTPVLIDVWATWCNPCRKSFEHAGPIQDYARENGIQLLYLSIDETPGIEQKWKNMANFYKLKGHHVLINTDIQKEVYKTFGENGWMSIPRHAIVDRDGNISLCPQPISESADFGPLRDLLEKVK